MEYVVARAKQVLTRTAGMPFRYSLNPYRGCRHACIYCYARVYHTYLGFEDPSAFDRIVLYKEDLAHALDHELARIPPPRGEIALGTATDPYQPLEARTQLTRSALKVLLRHGAAVTITTKSPLVLRDLDLLRAFAAYGGVRVHVTVTVLDHELWRLLEPRTPEPRARLELVAKLREAGVPTSVFVAPVVPFLGEEEAKRVLLSVAPHRPTSVMLGILRLGPVVKEWFLTRLAAARPDAARRLARLYRSRDLPPPKVRHAVLGPLHDLADALGLPEEAAPLSERPPTPLLFST